MTRRSPSIHALIVLLPALALGACTDPVRDQRIAKLGPERGPADAEHRPGEPCVLCHSAGGPASDHRFVVAGTVYETNTPGSPGATDVTVEIEDSNGLSPSEPALTNRAGNFFIREADFPDLAFPFRVRIIPPGGRPIEMSTTVNRDGSCGSCHAPFPETEPTEAQRDELRGSVGQIYLRGAP